MNGDASRIRTPRTASLPACEKDRRVSKGFDFGRFYRQIIHIFIIERKEGFSLPYAQKRRRYRIHYGRIFLALATFAFLITGLISLTLFLFDSRSRPNFGLLLESSPVADTAAQVESSLCYADNLRARKMEAALSDHIYSGSVLLMERESGRILFRKAAGERFYPASLTKMMSVLLAVENLPDPEQTVTLPDEIFSPLYEMNASMAGFQPGESPRVEELLYGAMLPSGAECTIGLGREIAGSDEGFVEKMNSRAAQLGMANTHFSNSTGLHQNDHYSTAEDMALLLRYALQNARFRQLFCTPTYVTPSSSYHPEGITMNSTMFRQIRSANIEDAAMLLGGKTGYTGEAGLCLASLAQVNGKEYILVTMGAPGSNRSEPMHILDAVTIYQAIPAFWGS